MTLQSCDILYVVIRSATLCGMWPWDPITYEERTTLLFGSLYPKVVVTVRLVVTTFPSSFLVFTIDRILNFTPSHSRLFPNDSPIYSPFIHHVILPSIFPMLLYHLLTWYPTRILDSNLIMLIPLSPLSCTILRSVMAGPFQASLVFNLSYVQWPSLRLDLLYQYQAIASEVPRNQYTTNSSTCEPSILRPLAWLHWIPLSHARCHDFV